MEYMTTYNNSMGDIIAMYFTGAAGLIWIAYLVLCILAWWKMFEKAGMPGWKALIPFYNMYCLYKIAFGRDKGWMFLLTLVPCVGAVIGIILNIRLAQNFGYGVGFALGLIFLNPIFMLILAFGGSQYIGESLS